MIKSIKINNKIHKLFRGAYSIILTHKKNFLGMLETCKLSMTRKNKILMGQIHRYIFE